VSSRGILGWRWAQLATAAGFGVGLGMILLLPAGVAGDALAYYHAGATSTYTGSSGTAGAFLYSPVIDQLLQPFRLLPPDAFVFLVRLVGLLSLAIVAGPFTGPILLFIPLLVNNPVVMELFYGNINLLLAVVALAGLRWPQLWSFALLTKVTPGIGLLWFLIRREWRKLGVALATTLLLVGVSFVFAPGLWFAWVQLLIGGQQFVPAGIWGMVPLSIRLPAAALLIAVGARRSWHWTLIVGTWLSIPVLWPQTLSVLAPLPLMGLKALGARRARRVRGRATLPSLAETAPGSEPA
jgi:hypothetical protein